MRIDRGTLMLLAILAVGAADAACKKSYEAERREAAEATAKAEKEAREAQQVTITSGTYEPNAEEKANEAEDEALRQQAEAIATLRREQLDYRGRLQKEIDELDRTIAGVRQTIEGTNRKTATAKDDAKASGLLKRRELLRSDIDAIDRSTSDDWPAVKGRIDKDLKVVPEPTPRSDRPWGEPKP